MQLWRNSHWQHLVVITGQFSIQDMKNWCCLLNLYLVAELSEQKHHCRCISASRAQPSTPAVWGTALRQHPRSHYQSQHNKTHRGALGTHPLSSGNVWASFAVSPQAAHLQFPGAVAHSYLVSLLHFLSAIRSVPWCPDELLCAGVDDSSPGEFREKLEEPKFKACCFLTFLLNQLCSRNERFTVGVKHLRTLLFIPCCKHCPTSHAGRTGLARSLSIL